MAFKLLGIQLIAVRNAVKIIALMVSNASESLTLARMSSASSDVFIDPGNAETSPASSSANVAWGDGIQIPTAQWTPISHEFFSPNKGGTTGVGFLLSLYRINFVIQDFPSPPTCLDLPRLA